MAQNSDGVSEQLADSIARFKKDSVNIANGAKVNGTVRDAVTGKPVAGIGVAIAEYSSAITDENGQFTISVPNSNVILIVTGQNYQKKEVSVKGRSTLPDILLYESNYNSVYTDAYMPFEAKVPVSRQLNAVSSVNTLGAWDVTSLETPDSYLQGKVAGLNVVRRSGTPNIGANLFLRGYNSLYATNAPLLVVDGMIYDTQHFGNSIIAGHIYNPYGELDLHDVDNFTILKDASAGIYGTKGSNGVILLSTNNHPDLATKIDFGIYSGYNYVNSGMLLPLMQSNNYRNYLSDLLHTNTAITPDQIGQLPYMNDDVNSGTYYAYHNNTDWQKQSFKNGYNENYNLRVSGGDDIARYVLALDYGTNKGISDLTDLTKYSTRFNGNLNISKHFTINTNLSFAYNQQDLKDQGLSPKTNPIFVGLIKSPLLRAHDVDAQGAESPNLSDSDIFGISNPAAITLNSQEKSQNYRFFGNFDFKYQFSKYVSAQTLIGVTSDKNRENTFIPRLGVANDTTSIGNVLDSRSGSMVQRLFNIYSDTYVSYNRTFNNNSNLSVNLGARYTNSTLTDNTLLGYNSSIDQLVSVDNGAAALRVSGGDVGSYSWLNTYLNANYSFANKYYLGATLAADASSRFGTDIPNALKVNGVNYAVLPTVSAAWVISSESFLSNIDFLELLKLRASYGLTGNDDIGNYTARQYYVSQNLYGAYGLVRGNFGNPALQWETGKKADIGLDASFFHDRLNITADVYQNTTDNMLTQAPLPSISGFTYAITNDGGMQTKGAELSITGRVINSRDFKWDLGFNIAAYRNKITKLPNDRMVNSYAGANILTQVGLPAGMFYGYKTNGVYATNAEAAAAGISVQNSSNVLVPQQGGDVRFVDVNNDHVINSSDMQVIGNPNPDFTGGISTGFTYKRFSLDALFTFSKGNDIYNYTRRQIESESNYNNQSLAVLNRWRVDGQVTDIPRASYGDPSGNASFSDRWIEDGSYIRLRTLSLTYNVPLSYKFIKYLKVYATANNLLTFTHYMGYDPEFAPNENVLLQGIDTTLEPEFKTVQLGLRIGI